MIKDTLFILIILIIILLLGSWGWYYYRPAVYSYKTSYPNGTTATSSSYSSYPSTGTGNTNTTTYTTTTETTGYTSSGTSTTYRVVGPGEHCGGNIMNAPVCDAGYYCAPTPGSTLPFGDVGGTCAPN